MDPSPITPLVSAVQARRDDHAFRVQLSSEDWAQLATVLERRELAPGELLMARGAIESWAYLVEQGSLQVFVVGGPPRSHRIATLREGTLVGEPALFGPVPRMAHVEALEACVVWKLDAQRLQTLAARAPRLVLEVTRAAGALLAARMRASLERGIPAI